MKKKQGNLKLLFLIFIVVELVLVIFSSSFNKKLQIGFAEGKFTIRNVNNYYDLQDKITQDFQRDEFLLKNSRINLHEINDFSGFVANLQQDNPLMKKSVSLMSAELQNLVQKNDTSWNDDNKSALLNEFNNVVINNPGFYESGFSVFISSDSDEKSYIIKKLNDGSASLSKLDTARLNRILIERAIPETVLARQQHLPRIYGSFELYNFFRQVFGEPAALSAFYLIRMLLIIDLIFLLIIVLISRNLREKPSKGQLLFEMVYSTFEDFVTDTLGKERAHFTPYIVTIFLFIWLCNMIGLIPVPGFMEPTRNINVPLGMGIIVIIVVHFTALRVKGIWGHLQNYLNPIKNPLAVLDIVSEFSKVVSISFRLFGNILGGAIIIVVVSSLVNYIVLPVGLNLFFGMFVGTVQAFVFTMLALTYIGVEISE